MAPIGFGTAGTAAAWSRRRLSQRRLDSVPPDFTLTSPESTGLGAETLSPHCLDSASPESSPRPPAVRSSQPLD